MKKISLAFLTLSLLITLISCDDGQMYYSYKDNTTKAEDKIVLSEKDIIYHTVTFKTNGGTPIENIQAKEIDTVPYTKKDNCEFDGWFLDETLTVAAVFPLEVNKDITLYAKWLKIAETTTCTDTKIKWDSDYSEAVYYKVTPSGFDFERLQQKGYSTIKINVTYDVYYKKDYDVLLDIGYAGSPKYEVSLYHSNLTGQFQEDLTTSTSTKTRTISGSILISDIPNDKITLKFSTNNIQNIIYFENITINYVCVK